MSQSGDDAMEQNIQDSEERQAASGAAEDLPSGSSGLGQSCLGTKKPTALEPVLNKAEESNLLQQMSETAGTLGLYSESSDQEDLQISKHAELAGERSDSVNDSDEDMDEVIPKAGKKRGRAPSKKKSKPLKKTRKTDQQPKRGSRAAPDLNGLMTGNIFDDAAAVEAAPAQPTFDASSRRSEAMSRIMESIPTEARAAANVDKRCLERACQAFGREKIKPADNGMWWINGLNTSIKPHQVLGTGFMLGRENDADEPRGGILADQMGLGKTLMTLALVVSGWPKVSAEVSAAWRVRIFDHLLKSSRVEQL